MGLGKTLQTLTFLARLRNEDRLGTVLLVVPTSLTYNWLSENEKFTPDLPMRMFSPKAKDSFAAKAPGVLLTTYGLLQEHAAFFKQFSWDIAIFDEAQNLKNISTQRTATARSLDVNIKICLTGTPLENHLGEFYSLVDLCVPGCLGDLDEFRKIYVNPENILTDDLRYLRLKTKPLVLRRTKAEILAELPEKQESRVILPFDEKQKKIYRDIAISYNDKVQAAIAEKGEAQSQLQMLTALLRLRQACSDPAALPGINYQKIPPKIEALTEALAEIVDAGESALVFTQFLHTLDRSANVLRASGLPVFVIHGALARAGRERALHDFNACLGGAILIMTLKTGGVGLNLTKASYVFHLEPWWNPAVENQATDRAHRLGQKRAVQVYRYIMHESVEEKIERLKAQKQRRFDAMFTELETPPTAEGITGESTSDSTSESSAACRKNASHLSRADFEFLLSV